MADEQPLGIEVLAESKSVQLIDAGRDTRRSIADVVAVLRKLPRFSERMRAVILVRPWQLPAGNWTACIQVFCETQKFAVSLPSSAHFFGTRTLGSGPERFDIERLDGATAECNVTLRCGLHLHCVSVEPTFIPLALTRGEERIVMWTIRRFHPRKRCFRYLPNPNILHPLRRGPKLGCLDYGTLRSLKLPALKEIVYSLREMYGFGDYSRQTISNALARSGMRLRHTRHT